MKSDMKVTAVISNGKRAVLAEVDAIRHAQPPGITLVFTWGIKEGETEEEPIDFVKIPLPNLKKISEGHYALEGAPVYWENLEEIGL